MRGGEKNLQFAANTAFAERDRLRPLVSTRKHYTYLAAGRLAPSSD